MLLEEQYRIERLSKEKLKDMSFLFEINKNLSHSSSYFEQKFETSFTSKTYIGYIAYNIERKQPAAVYVVYPCYIHHKNEKVLSAQSGDTITNPNDQKKGLFVTLAMRTYELAKKEGIKVIFGFPNNNSQHAFFNRLNWTKSPPLINYKIKAVGIPFFKILKKLNLLNSVYYPYLNQLQKLFKPSDNILLLSNEEYYDTRIIKDKHYRKYKKYEKSFMFRYRDITIWYKPGGEVRIGLIYLEEGSLSNKLILTLKILGFLIGIPNISITVSLNSFYDKALNLHYSPNSKTENVGYLILDKKIGDLSINHSEADFDTF